ncbi:hypothetical protein D9981_11660 [Pseudoalteromonas phenolica O-BC30]|nr:hypothetical protein D9981_11660 [Pseudoalteromonas phenolica O-BC30]TMO54189.1 hypothetical protein CWC21_15875 [Pseudoalteromonas phenolica]
MTLAVFKISHLEQLNSKILALLSTNFSCLKIASSIKRISIIDLSQLSLTLMQKADISPYVARSIFLCSPHSYVKGQHYLIRLVNNWLHLSKSCFN